MQPLGHSYVSVMFTVTVIITHSILLIVKKGSVYITRNIKTQELLHG